jgi:hypothetical protein
MLSAGTLTRGDAAGQVSTSEQSLEMHLAVTTALADSVTLSPGTTHVVTSSSVLDTYA